jgi:hypothetical protein
MREAIHDADHAGAGNVGSAGMKLTTVVRDEQHFREDHFLTDLAECSIDGDSRARRHLDLPSARLNDCVHVALLLTTQSDQCTTWRLGL